MKRCARCGDTKPVDQFHRNKALPDGRQGYCKPCRKLYDHDYHLRVRPRRIAQKQAAWRRRLEWLRELRADKPCTDCGRRYPAIVMQWDHLPGFEKLGEISGRLRKASRAKILAEIEKCELVCANCHALRTFNRIHGFAEELAEYRVAS